MSGRYGGWGIHPSVWHANEDHKTLMMIERIWAKYLGGLALTAALEGIRAGTVLPPIPR